MNRFTLHVFLLDIYFQVNWFTFLTSKRVNFFFSIARGGPKAKKRKQEVKKPETSESESSDESGDSSELI